MFIDKARIFVKAGHGGNRRQRKDYPRVERAENAQPDRCHRKRHEKVNKLPHHSLDTLAVSVAGVACFLVAVHDIGIFKVFEINCHYLAVLFAYQFETRVNEPPPCFAVVIGVEHGGNKLYYREYTYYPQQRQPAHFSGYHVDNEF